MEKDNVFTYEPKMKANLELIMDIMRCDCQEIVYMDEKIEVLEKALELACEEINRVEAKFGSAYIRANGYLVDYFKTKAKEMKSE